MPFFKREHFLSLIYSMRGENVVCAKNEIALTENMDPGEYNNYINRKTYELLDYVSNNINYYKESMSSVVLSGYNVEEVLFRLQITDKLLMKNNLIDFISAGFRKSWRSTSGTTGVPFVFPKDRFATGYMDAMMYRAYGWHGINPVDKQARIWGRSVKFKDRFVQIIKDKLLCRLRLSAFELNSSNCIKYYYLFLKYKPKYFYCYPNALYQFALSISKAGLDGKRLGIKVAICTGEILFQHIKDYIQNVFGCTVVNEYGSSENGIIGFECSCLKMHIMPTVRLDIINCDNSGFGEILITELNSRVIPFVKYKLGDIGRIVNDECECGLPYPLLEIKEGRVDNFIICSDGSIVYDAILAYVLKDYVEQFKAIQIDFSTLSIDIVQKHNIDDTALKRAEITLQSYLGKDMLIILNKVDAIKPDKSGKLRYFVPINNGMGLQ